MKISIDTKEDSHEEIKKVIQMLQNLVGGSQDIFTNQPIKSDASNASKMEINAEATGTAFSNIFSDNDAPSEERISGEDASQPTLQEHGSQAQNQNNVQYQTQGQKAEDMPDSTEDLFAELFSEEELKRMDAAKIKDAEEQEDVKPKGKKYSIELY